MGLCGENIQIVELEPDGAIVEQFSNFNYVGNLIPGKERH